MKVKIFILLICIFPSLQCICQDKSFRDLLNDISTSKILSDNIIQSSYYSNSTTLEFDKYVYVKKSIKSDTIDLITMMKSQQVKGILSSCTGCAYYDAFKITSANPLYPSLALSTNRNGFISKAIYNTGNKQLLSVGDINSDRLIDYASYYLGEGLYGVILVHRTLLNTTAFLIYNSFEKSYIGILTFKGNENNKIFNRGLVKNGDTWNSYRFVDDKLVFLKSMKEPGIDNRELPDAEDIEPADTPVAGKKNPVSKNENEFINLMKSVYSIAIQKWNEDYKIVQTSDVIGARLPEIIVLNK